MNDQVFWKKIPQSIHHAIDGLRYLLRTQQNARAHGFIAVVVVIAGFLFDLNREDWLILVLTILLVWIAEVFNTAMEVVVDLIRPDIHPAAKVCKDVSAAGVLIAAVGSILIGTLIFGPRVWNCLDKIVSSMIR